MHAVYVCGGLESHFLMKWLDIYKYYPSCLYITSVKIIKNEVGCRDDTVPKTVDTRREE